MPHKLPAWSGTRGFPLADSPTRATCLVTRSDNQEEAVSAGIYFWRLARGGDVFTAKIILLR